MCGIHLSFESVTPSVSLQYSKIRDAIHFDEDIGNDKTKRRDLITDLHNMKRHTKRTIFLFIFIFISPQKLPIVVHLDLHLHPRDSCQHNVHVHSRLHLKPSSITKMNKGCQSQCSAKTKKWYVVPLVNEPMMFLNQ
jgi:hypothetical protein